MLINNVYDIIFVLICDKNTFIISVREHLIVVVQRLGFIDRTSPQVINLLWLCGLNHCLIFSLQVLLCSHAFLQEHMIYRNTISWISDPNSLELDIIRYDIVEIIRLVLELDAAKFFHLPAEEVIARTGWNLKVSCRDLRAMINFLCFNLFLAIILETVIGGNLMLRIASAPDSIQLDTVQRYCYISILDWFSAGFISSPALEHIIVRNTVRTVQVNLLTADRKGILSGKAARTIHRLSSFVITALGYVRTERQALAG